jgi:hypothetical protein
VSLPLAKAFRVRVQLREDGFQFVDIDVQNALKELVADFLESGLQVRSKTQSLARRLDYQESMVSGVNPARDKTIRFEPVNKSRDLAFVSPHRFGKLPRRSLTILRTMQEHGRLLRGQAELAEASIKRGLQSDARPEEPGNRELRLPLSNLSIFPLGLPR